MLLLVSGAAGDVLAAYTLHGIGLRIHIRDWQ